MEQRIDPEIGPNVNERMADRPRPDEPRLDEIPLPVIDTDSDVSGLATIDDV